PNADRDKETSIPINQATFLMSNMVAQAPDNNQGPWAEFENYLRTLLPSEEIYIVAGGAGTGGSGSHGGVTTTLADGHVTVPASTWKVALVLPKDNADDIARVSCSTRTIALIMPNAQGIRTTPWDTFLTNVDSVEILTGYDFFSNLPEPIQRCVEAGTNGNNPPLVKGAQQIVFAAPADRTYGDASFAVSATGGSSGNPVTFAASGACTSGGVNGSTISVVAAGSCAITASQAGNELYEAAATTRTLTIYQADATIAVTGFTGWYDGAVHGAIGSATGVGTDTLTGLLHLGATFVNAPGGIANWTFEGNTNYNTAAGAVTIEIARVAPAFSGIGEPVIEAGTAATTLSGGITLGALVPSGSVSVTLNGVTQTASIDADGRFAAAFATAALAPAVYVTTFSYAGDSNFTGATAAGTVTIADTTAPAITNLSATPGVLRPANHRMIDVALAYQSADVSGAPACSVAIASNEPVDAAGDGNTMADWLVIDSHHVQLRAERAGGGSGRIYTISVSCADGSGNTSTAGVTVSVPRR
ncbi:MAG: DNA/RNA non-specific endonuclease, partial [Vicinamibacterales bacterium]